MVLSDMENINDKLPSSLISFSDIKAYPQAINIAGITTFNAILFHSTRPAECLVTCGNIIRVG